MNLARAQSRRRREVTLPYEKAYPWEDEQGSTLDRTVEVSAEAKRVYTRQEQLLPTLALERPADPGATEHLQDVGRRVLILRDSTKQSRRKNEDKQSPKQLPLKRVIPSRYPEISLEDEVDLGEANREEDPAVADGRIATMLMDQEWDTRAWNTTKVQTGVDTLFEEIEHCDDEARRELATTMLLRLLETHEDAVDYVETTLPSLTNKAFRTLSKLTNNTKIFRVVRLVAVLAEWFAGVISGQSGVAKCINCLLRETELCARILQHHWRGVLFERTVNQRDYDPAVKARLRSMHLVKFVELRHQFKVYREAVGPGGVPSSVTQAYVTILQHLVKLPREDGSALDKTRSTVLSDQRRILGSGVLSFLASLITTHQSRKVIELVKEIILEITDGHGDEQIIEILQCNVVERVVRDLKRTMQADIGSNSVNNSAGIAEITSSLKVLSAIAAKVHIAMERWGNRNVLANSPVGRSPTRPMSSSYRTEATMEERGFLLRKLKVLAHQFLLTSDVFDTLFEVLTFCHDQGSTLRAQVLNILCLLARSFGFKQLLDALTREGGRRLEQVLLSMKDDDLMIAEAAMTLFYDMTSVADGRLGLTAAGAVQILLRWCRPSFEASESQMAFVTAFIGLALLARQTDHVKPVNSLLESLAIFENRLDAMYTLLLDLAIQDDSSPRASEKTAAFFFSVEALPTIVGFLTQVTPSCMDSPLQNARQRNISCILLGRLFKVSQVTRICFSEDVINHLALSIQCNRLDEIEGLVAKSTPEDRLVHQLGSKEACKALSRLARCPSNMVEARLRPSITSYQVPEWPQAMICDVMFRMHVLEDLISLIRVPSDAAEFADVDLSKVIAAVELVGYIRPLPYGESAREKFLKTHHGHPHGKYAQEKLLQVVELVAPAILHILREKSANSDLVSACFVALSRLACTNEACGLLLTQGCLQTALIHLPDILLSTAGGKSPQKRQTIEFDSRADDQGLFDVPAALYTLFGKLCAIAEGRTGIMRAQILPRFLKRMQLHHPTSRVLDDDCKSEIAVVIFHLAMTNAVEGSTSELFLHFHVLELLAKILQQHNDLILSLEASSTVARKKDDVKRWRLLDHTIGAVAALSQDVLVCVPRVVSLSIVELLFPFLARLRQGENPNPHLVALQYHTVTIIRSIASYPFGEYHPYLANAKGAAVTLKKEGGKADKTGSAASRLVMERVKQIGFDFAMELENKPMATRDKKTVGELARETLAFINEHQQRLQRQRQSQSNPGISSNNRNGIGEKERQTNRPVLASPIGVKESPTGSSFPTLPQSPVHRTEKTRSTSSRKPSKETVIAPKESPAATTPSVLILDGGSKSPVSLNGINIASTRPPGKNLPESPQHHHYVFTRPKTKPKRQEQDPAHCLMLDPLFDTGNRVTRSYSLQKDNSKQVGDMRHLSSEDDSFSYSHEIDRFGYYAGVQAYRDKRGDRYFPSLGRIVTTEPISPEASRQLSGFGKSKLSQ